MQKIRIAFIGITLFWIGILFYSLLTYVKETPIRFDFAFKRYINIIFPQGWAFFTKSPRDNYLQLYRWERNHLKSVDGQRQATVDNLMGFRRYSRAMSVEYGYLLNNIPSTKWIHCDTSPEEYIRSHHSIENVRVFNNTPKPYLNGTYYLIDKSIVPWAWASKVNNINFTCSIMKLTIVCSH